MDFIERALSEKFGIRVFFTEVSESAATLERRHLSGPTAGRVLAEGIAAAALLSADLKSEDESVSLQLKSDGAIGGIMVDASGSGNLRGYTHKKILNEYDGEDPVDLSAVMGEHGLMAVIRSNPVRVLSVGQVTAEPPLLDVALARYFNDSQQTPTAVELYTTSKDGYLKRAVGLTADRMPGGDSEAFCEVLERFQSGAVERFLDSAAGALDFKELFGLDDLESVGRRDLRFGCNCNYEKITEAVATLPDAEIRQILESGHAQRVTCHFCGELYTVQEETLRQILETETATLLDAGPEPTVEGRAPEERQGGDARGDARGEARGDAARGGSESRGTESGARPDDPDAV